MEGLTVHLLCTWQLWNGLKGSESLSSEFSWIPSRVSWPPGKLIKANTLTVISLNKSARFIFHSSSYRVVVSISLAAAWPDMILSAMVVTGTRAVCSSEMVLSKREGVQCDRLQLVSDGRLFLCLCMASSYRWKQKSLGEGRQLFRMHSLYPSGCLCLVGLVCCLFQWRIWWQDSLLPGICHDCWRHFLCLQCSCTGLWRSAEVALICNRS